MSPGRLGKVLEKELVIEDQSGKKLLFETEVFSNGYKIFQFLKRPIKPTSRHS